MGNYSLNHHRSWQQGVDQSTCIHTPVSHHDHSPWHACQMGTHCTLFSSLLKSVHRPISLPISSALGVLYRRGRSSLGKSAIQTSLRNSWPTFRPTNCKKSCTHKHFKFIVLSFIPTNSYLKTILNYNIGRSESGTSIWHVENNNQNGNYHCYVQHKSM